MVDETDNIVLEHLRAIRGDVAQLRVDVSELTTRIGGLERSVAHLHVTLAEQSARK
jgi:hypothetical protein